MEDPERQLAAEVARLTGIGYKLNDQTDTSANLFRPKRLSLKWSILTLGLHFMDYLASYDQHVFLWVEDGKLRRSGTIRRLETFIVDKLKGRP